MLFVHLSYSSFKSILWAKKFVRITTKYYIKVRTMLKKLWDAIHFGRFTSQWRNDPPADASADTVALGKTLFYESYLQKTGDSWTVITKRGGLIGRYAFYLMLPVYAAFIAAIFLGKMNFGHLALFEAFFIAAFGLFNGFALHKLAQDPGFGVEELSLHRIQRS